MSVLGSQLEMDLDPEGECVIFNGQRHIGNTGTGCYKLHDTKIKETKKPPNLPLDDKVDATWIYAPTPTPPPEEPDEDDGGLYFPYVSVPFHMLFTFFLSGDEKGPGGNNGECGAGQPTPSKDTMSNGNNGNMALMNNGSSFNPEQNNQSAHAPHLLDAPVQGAHEQSNQLAPAPVMAQQRQNQDSKPLNSPSQKSSSIGVSFCLMNGQSI